MDRFQEKFQTILPPAPDEDDGTEWKTFESQRHTFQPGQDHENNATSSEEAQGKFNILPPNMELENQNPMKRELAGCTDVSYDNNPEAYRKGYTRRAMNGTDDLYTGEHIDHFYGIAYGHDEDEREAEGFAERNNYLDRE